jgi:hypothetical protein
MNSTKKKSGKKPQTIVFDDLAEYLAYVKKHGVVEVYVTAIANPPLTRDPREDVYHVVLTAQIAPDPEANAKPKIWNFTDALNVDTLDQTVQGRAKFKALVDKELKPYLDKVRAAKLVVKRGMLT